MTDPATNKRFILQRTLQKSGDSVSSKYGQMAGFRQQGNEPFVGFHCSRTRLHQLPPFEGRQGTTPLLVATFLTRLSKLYFEVVNT